jgi:hypothetical protein
MMRDAGGEADSHCHRSRLELERGTSKGGRSSESALTFVVRQPVQVTDGSDWIGCGNRICACMYVWYTTQRSRDQTSRGNRPTNREGR